MQEKQQAFNAALQESRVRIHEARGDYRDDAFVSAVETLTNVVAERGRLRLQLAEAQRQMEELNRRLTTANAERDIAQSRVAILTNGRISLDFSDMEEEPTEH